MSGVTLTRGTHLHRNLRELVEDGYSGVKVRNMPMRTEIIIRAPRTQNMLGEKGRRIRELTSVVQKSFKFPENTVELYAEKVNNQGLCAIAQANSCATSSLDGLLSADSPLRAEQKDRYMISSGLPLKEYNDAAVRHVLLRQGVLGIKVKIMLDWDPKGRQGPMTPLPDLVTIHAPKEEEEYARESYVAPVEVPKIVA